MAGNLGVKLGVVGDVEIRRTLGRLPVALEEKILAEELRREFRPLLAEIKAVYPRSEIRRRSGQHVADTLRLIPLRPRPGRVGVQIVTGTREELGIDPDDPYYYPAALELGTSKTAALAPMRRTMARREEQILSNLQRNVSARIIAEAKK